MFQEFQVSEPEAVRFRVELRVWGLNTAWGGAQDFALKGLWLCIQVLQRKA